MSYVLGDKIPVTMDSQTSEVDATPGDNTSDPSHYNHHNPTVYDHDVSPAFLVRKPSQKQRARSHSTKRSFDKLTTLKMSPLKKFSGLRNVQFADEPVSGLRRSQAIIKIQDLQREYEKTKETNALRKQKKEPLKRQQHAMPKAFRSVMAEDMSSSFEHKSTWSHFEKSPFAALFSSKKKKDLDAFPAPEEKVEGDEPPKVMDKKLVGIINDKAGNNHIQRSFSLLQRHTSITRHASISGPNAKLRAALKKHSISKRPFELHSILKQLRTTQNKPFIMRIMYRMKKKFSATASKFKAKIDTLAEPLEPHGVFKTIWNFLLLLVIVYELIITPVRASFDVGYDATFINIEIVESALFLLDILITFHTCYYVESVAVTSRRDIAVNYMRSWFWLDFLAFLPIHVAFQDFDHSSYSTIWYLLNLTKTSKVFRLLKFFKLRKQLSTVKEFFRLSMDVTISVEMNGALRLGKMFVIISFLAHWMACFWHLVSLTQGVDSWIWRAGLEHAPWGDRYLAALYWAATTMLTVGYGDISASNSAERAYNIGSMLLGCGVFGYTMNQIGDIINQINAEASYKDMRMDQLTKFLAKNEVDPAFQKKIKEYMEFKLDHERTLRETDQVILDSVSGSLKAELLRQINGKVLKNNVLFQRSFGSHFLLSLSMSLNEKVLAPDEYIFRENDSQNISIYFVIRGKVALYLERYSIPLKTLGKGDHLGELAFFTSAPREATARTLTFCSLFYISKDRFEQLMQEHQTDAEMYHMVKDRVKLYHEYKSIGSACLVCGSHGHLHPECLIYHLIGSHEDVIKRHRWHTKTFEEIYMRKPRRRFNVLVDLKEIQLRAKQYKMTESLKNQPISHAELSAPERPTREKKRQLTIRIISEPTPVDPTQATKPDSTSVEALETEAVDLSNPMLERLEVPKFRSEAKGVKNELPVITSATLQALAGGDAALRAKYRKKLMMEKEGRSEDDMIRFVESPMEELVIDQIRNYQLYFPHNNLTKIVEMMEAKHHNRKYYNIKLESDHEIVQFKKKLGQIFHNQKRMSVSGTPGQMPPVQRKKSIFGRLLGPNASASPEKETPFAVRSRTMI